jgi:RNase H-fold protein (predicted Holliday junction resolvase)
LTEKIVLAIDPGSAKVGMALASRDGDGGIRLLWRSIVPRDKVALGVAEARETADFQVVVVGSGTKSKELVSELREAMPGVSLMVVDEKNTTLEARARYWEHFPRRGWRRLLPASLQVPNVDLDDFAAFVIAERVLAG